MSLTNVDAPGGSIQLRNLPMSRLRPTEGEVRRLRLAGADSHGLRLRPELLVPGVDGVRAGGEILDRERAVRAGRREERMRQHAHPGVHPAVHVALERNHHLGCREASCGLHPGRRLADVEAAVLLRYRLDVVEHRIVVLDEYLLIDYNAEDTRPSEATILVDLQGGAGLQLLYDARK